MISPIFSLLGLFALCLPIILFLLLIFFADDYRSILQLVFEITKYSPELIKSVLTDEAFPVMLVVGIIVLTFDILIIVIASICISRKNKYKVGSLVCEGILYIMANFVQPVATLGIVVSASLYYTVVDSGMQMGVIEIFASGIESLICRAIITYLGYFYIVIIMTALQIIGFTSRLPYIKKLHKSKKEMNNKGSALHAQDVNNERREEIAHH